MKHEIDNRGIGVSRPAGLHRVVEPFLQEALFAGLGSSIEPPLDTFGAALLSLLGHLPAKFPVGILSSVEVEVPHPVLQLRCLLIGEGCLTLDWAR